MTGTTDRLALRRLFAPRTVAVAGGAPAERVITQCKRLGFRGTVWAVHPERTEIAGVPCVPSLDAVPEPPDAVFLGINRLATIGAMRALVAKGAGGAVCYASGFAETGDTDLQEQLVDAAGRVPFLGPNCYGYVNAFDRVALWPDEHGMAPLDEGVAIVSQSGNVGLNLTFQQRSLRLGMMISVGNQARVGMEDAIDALLDDGRVTAVGLFVEAVRDATRFAAVAARAHAQGVPVVALQTGRSATGASIAASHTGSMAGRAAAYDALFARCGVATVRTPAALLETLKLLDHSGPLSGTRVVSLSCSGGEASLVADLAEPSGLVVERFADDHRERIEASLADTPHGDLVTVTNPFDYHTFMWGDRQAMARCFTSVMDGPQDVTMLVLDAPPSSDNDASSWLPAVDALGDAAEATGNRGVVVATLPECLPQQFREHAIARGLTPLLGLHEGLAALRAAAAAGVVPGPPPAPATVPRATRSVDEGAAKARLRYLGIPVPDGQMVLRHGVLAAADEVGYPVTLKGVGIGHKSDVGAVHVGLPDPHALSAAMGAMPEDVLKFLVERTVTDVVAEVLVAVRRDAPVGWLVTLGFGGVSTELWQDVTHLLAPVTVTDVVAALARLRSAPLLTGFRGRPAADIGALAELVVAVVDAVVGTTVVEVELNPVLVGRTGAIVVDALWVEEAPA